MGKDIWFDKNLLRSDAFRSLSKRAMLVYLDFLRKRQMYEGKGKPGKGTEWVIKNNGEIVYTYAEAERKGISRNQFRDAIDELIAQGFLDINHLGSGGHKGDVTTFFIDDRWPEFGTDRFRPPKNPRPRDARSGRGWESIWNDPVRKKMLLQKRMATAQSSISKTIPEEHHRSIENDTRNS